MSRHDIRGDASRVAVISLHTSPLDQPGAGDSGGMNVYIREVAERLAEQGVSVDIYTRCSGRDVAEVEEIGPRSRLIQVQAGPCAPVAKADLPPVVPAFLDNVLQRVAMEHEGHAHAPYDVVHSHYWLSGWVGRRAKQIWGAPLVASFHTLAKVKNSSLAAHDRPEPAVRVNAEHRVVERADRILAPTPIEASELVDLYGADPGRVRVVPPGVDAGVFSPRPQREARERLGLHPSALLLFVGRLQPLKGPDVAIRAMAELATMSPELSRGAMLAVVGGPGDPSTGPDELERLRRSAADLGVGERVVFFPPQSHASLADFYSAADAVLMPSRSESFGLVALEAQACGTPVIAAASGGLRHAVLDGKTGFLVQDHDPRRYAERVLLLLREPRVAASLGKAALRHAAGFSWEATAADIRRVYEEVVTRRAA